LRTVVAETLTPSLWALADDPQVAPAPVLPGLAQDEDDDLFTEGIGGWAATTREGPGPGHQVTVR